jgi:multidrug efflux pump subunit AcrB
MRNISAWAIRNPIPPIVLFLGLTLAGIVSFARLDINNMPDVSVPFISVTVPQPGAAPTEMESQITQRIEAAVRGVSGVDEISSFIQEGASTTNVQFDIGTPVDRALNDVRNAVSQIRGDLPDGILEPQVTRIDVEGGPIGYYSAESTDMTIEELSWYVDNTVAKRLLSVSGMAAVQRSGGVSREIRIVLDPAKLQSQGLTAAQVNQQLRLVNLNATGGRAEVAGSEQAVRVLGSSRNALSLSETQISVGNGRTVRLGDIASVSDAYAEQRNIAKMNGRQVLSFGVSKAKGASDVTVYDEMHKVLDKLEEENPKVKFTELFTTVEYTKGQYSAAMEAMIEGALLAVLVVWLFLRDWRATVISAIAIPLSAIPTFWFMDLMGFTLNTISLLALSLVAGVLVDDAIVEIENIVRHMRMGKSAYQASMDAADEIGLAVVATTFSIVAVFLPVGLMPGVSGQFFEQFGMTVVVAVLLSLLVARLITPMIAAYFLEAKGMAPHGEAKWIDSYMRVLHWTLDESKAQAARARGGMARRFAWAKDHRWWMMGIGALSFLATIVAYGTLPSAFQPTLDQDYSQVSITMTPGTTLEQTERTVDTVVNILRKEQEVLEAFAEVNVGEGTIYVRLRKDRERSSVDFERAMGPVLTTVPDARIYFQSQMGGGPSGRDIVLMFAGDDPDKLYATALQLVEQMRGIDTIRAPRIEGDLRKPEITIKPRFDLAADLGVTTQALSQTIRIATIGDIDQNVAKFSLADRQIPIRVVIDESARRDLASIENLPVPTVSGGTVPLKIVADIGFGSGPTILRRFNQQRRIVVSADLAQGKVSSDATKAIDKLPLMQNLPNGIEKVTFGQQKMQTEMVTNFGIAVVSGVLLVFAVLVLLYRKILPPFVNMGSLLLAPLGGAVALHLTGNVVSMPVFIGILMLLGIVAKNSILLIDFALEEMQRGVDKTTAIIDAGHKRAQPIVMTTIAMAAGMIPTAIALSGDAAWRAPMGITVIGGLILSTVLTLLIIPAGFSLADDVEQWMAPKFKKFLTFKPGDDRPSSALPQPAE